MARRGNSVFGIDLGNHAFKGVLLERKGDDRFVLTSYASRPVPEDLKKAADFAQHIKLLLKDIGGSASGCALAFSHPESLLRIIEQPNTPVDLLRNALRLNGLMVLNQECKDFVLDCAPLSADAKTASGQNGSATAVATQTAVQTKYLVGGMLRPTVKQISEACSKSRISVDILQLAPVCSFNAFECAYPDTFAKETFLLLDMGHLQSTLMIGTQKELVLVRSVDYGGKALTAAVTANGGVDVSAAHTLIQQGDAGMAETCRTSLGRLATEVRNSIGFFEGQHEQNIHRIFVSGGLARAEMVLQTLSDELGLPCEIWDPLETCEVALPSAKRQALPHEFVSLNVACGAAFEYLRN